MKKLKRKVLPGVNANPGLTALYKRRLLRMVECMARSVEKWIPAAYNQAPPAMAELAQDALPSSVLTKIIGELRKRWTGRFEDGAEQLARYFAKSAARRTDAQLQKILGDAGWSVEFRLTRAQRDILAATVQENVSLIKSIPEEYFKSVETQVMQSVKTGMDVGGLKKKLKKSYGVSDRRAGLIARDQNLKATSALTRARQLEFGIDRAVWHHSHAGKVPRPSHLANDGETYDVAKGWFDPDAQEWIHPGQLINCRCTSRSIIEGFI